MYLNPKLFIIKLCISIVETVIFHKFLFDYKDILIPMLHLNQTTTLHILTYVFLIDILNITTGLLDINIIKYI